MAFKDKPPHHQKLWGWEQLTNQIYEQITARILQQLQKGTVPWRQPWRTTTPHNLVTRRAYRGINVIVLGMAGYDSPYWVTYHQAQALGGYVRRGEQSHPVVFWKWIANDEDEYPLLRSYRVFNTHQCEGLTLPPQAHSFAPSADAERVIKNMPRPPRITHHGPNNPPSAYYHLATDTVVLPQPGRFTGTGAYYATLFHELVHSTGHPSRLHRVALDTARTLGEYSLEELIAEMGSAFLCQHAQLDTSLDAPASYIAGWLAALHNDQRMVVVAGAKAQRAADYILGVSTDRS